MEACRFQSFHPVDDAHSLDPKGKACLGRRIDGFRNLLTISLHYRIPSRPYHTIPYHTIPTTTTMLIRVDIYPEGATKASSTLHACLATTTTTTTGKALLTVGRKAGNVTFPRDKSVSRQHCQLVVVGDDETICHRKPQNDKEIKACENSKAAPLQQMCLVLENAGKGGSYVAIPKIRNATDHDKMKTDDDNGNATSDDETDDEGISQAKSLKLKASQGGGGAVDEDLPLLSAATCQHWKSDINNQDNDDQPVQLHKLDADESYVFDFTTTNTIMVQCGRFESTFCLTKLDWNIAFSRLSNTVMKPLRKQLPLIGAVAVPDDLPDASTTFLVTSERIAGAKQLIAWCYQIPLTSPAFIQACLDRKTADDPMPTPVDYPVSTSDSKSFWDTAPNPKLLADYHFFSIESNELERLAAAAGAQLVALYSSNDDDNDEEETADFDPLAKAQEFLNKQGVAAFALPSRKKLSKQLQELGVHMVTAKQLASSISQQKSPLVDSKGNDILVANRIAAEEPPPAHVEEPTKNTITSRKPSVQEDVQPKPESPTVESSKREYRSNRRKRDDESEPQQESSMEIETETATQLPPPRKKSKVVQEGKAEPVPSKVVENAETSFPMADEEEDPDNSHKSAAADDSKLSTILEPEEQGSSSFERESSAFVEKKPPPLARPVLSLSNANATALGGKDADGWFVAAPNDDDHRKQIRKRAAKLMAQENGGFAFLPPAATATVTHLVDKSQSQSATAATSSVRSSTTTTTTTPNFKKFRKNSIRKPGVEARIAVRHVLPKVLERQKVLQEQHQELEEERRIADELFGDQAKTIKKRRRA